MIVVMQCAAAKRPDAGYLRTTEGKPVVFVANPEAAPHVPGKVYARPDDLSDRGVSWRQVLLDYNARPAENPLGLLAAYRLYGNPVYERIVDQFGVEKVYILSAGWGLIGAGFLTPFYDITFSQSAESYKRRRKTDLYEDFGMLAFDSADEIAFFGGKDYLPLFCS
jgi:hypothetical protein